MAKPVQNLMPLHLQSRCAAKPQQWSYSIVRNLFWTTPACSSKTTPFCILNAGLLYGQTRALLEMYDWVLKEHFYMDQCRFGAYAKAFADLVAFDSQHEAFGTIWNAVPAYEVEGPGRVRNKVSSYIVPSLSPPASPLSKPPQWPSILLAPLPISHISGLEHSPTCTVWD